jgi:D-3-phosphoglycerate dehydrogenase
MLSVVATSYAWIDVAAARKRGILISNVPGYARYSVSELVLAFILDWARKVRQADAAIRLGKNDRAPFLGTELFEKTLGVVGLGSIGSRVAIIAKALGMNVQAATLHPDRNRAKALGVKLMDIDTLFATSDIISVHVPLNENTRGLIGKKQFEVIKRGAFFVYTSRPGVCDENALLWALETGNLGGAGLDETSEAFRAPDSPLLKMANVCLTPEIGFFTREALVRLTDISIDNVECFIQGKATNIVN